MKRNDTSLSPAFRLSALAVLPLLLGVSDGCSSPKVPIGEDRDPVGQCSLAACSGLARTEEAKLCSDGSAVGRSVCAQKSDGTCFWDFPTCPSTGTPEVDAGATACTLADCMGKPVQDDAKLCPDGTALGRSVCAQSTSGACNWDFPSCPSPTTADAGCGCVPDIKWGLNGGFVAYQDQSSITACFDYVHARTTSGGGAGPSCHQTLLGCGSGLRSGRDIVSFLDHPDVKQAILSKTILYGGDPRPVDGTVFRIEVGGAIIEVGTTACTAPAGCLALPPGVSMLANELRAIDAQELGFEPCKSAFPSR